MKFITVSFITVLLFFLTGCSRHVSTGSEPKRPCKVYEDKEEPLSIVSGIVIAKNMQGKDGSVWEFEGLNGKSYSLVISIPNLGQKESKNIDYVIPSAKLTITGEVYEHGIEYSLIARKISLTK
jgi:hypothetical protein